MATSAELQKLATVLGRPAAELNGLAVLDAAQLTSLTTGFAAAQKAQRAELEQAIQTALGHLPLLLRGPVVKILRG